MEASWRSKYVFTGKFDIKTFLDCNRICCVLHSSIFINLEEFITNSKKGKLNFIETRSYLFVL